MLCCRRYLEDNEPFDRGFYAGPFGWVSGQGAEFVVAIRSAMVPTYTPLGTEVSAAIAAATTPVAAGAAAEAAAGATSLTVQRAAVGNLQQQAVSSLGSPCERVLYWDCLAFGGGVWSACAVCEKQSAG